MDLIDLCNSNTGGLMRASCNQKRGKKRKKRSNCSNPSSPLGHFTQGTVPCHFSSWYHPVSNYGERTASDASSIPACWHSVKNRSVYWAGVSFTMVNMCVSGRWRVDGFAAAWHLIYGSMRRGGWSRPPLSLNQIISAPRKTNDGC